MRSTYRVEIEDAAVPIPLTQAVKAARDTSSALFGKQPLRDNRIVTMVPFVGKHIYWWWGGGVTKMAKEEKRRAKQGKKNEK